MTEGVHRGAFFVRCHLRAGETESETDMRTHTARTRREYRRSGNPPTPQAHTRKGKEYKHRQLATQNVYIRPIVII